jgi:PTS system fructose-specific IIC component
MIAPTESPWLSAPVSLCLTASTQEEAIRRTVDLWAGTPALAGTLPSLLAGVLAREEQKALPNGVALPHARSPLLQEPLVAAARLEAPVLFAGTPVWLVIAIASPMGQPAKHLELLRRLSQALARTEVLAALRAATTLDEMRALFLPG